MLLAAINLNASLYMTINKDSLMNTLKNLPEKAKIEQLYKLAEGHAQGNKCKDYIELYLKESQKIKDSNNIGKAYFFLAQYYYLVSPDSMRYFIKKAEPFLINSNNKEELFRMKAWNIFSLNLEGKNSQIIPEVNALKKLSVKMNYPNGSEMADQALANFYFGNKLETEGTKICLDVLHRMEMRKAPMLKRINVIRLILSKSNDYTLKEELLSKIAQYIKEMNDKKIDRLDNVISIESLNFYYHKCAAEQAAYKKNAPLMLYHIQQTDKWGSKRYGASDALTIRDLWLNYYLLTKDYAKALPLVDEMLVLTETTGRTADHIDLLKKKSDILYHQGHMKEAMDLYISYNHLNDSISAVQYFSDLAKLRAQHDVDQLEIQNKQLELKESKTHVQLIALSAGIFILILVSISLFIFSVSRHRLSQQMKKARDKAEEADRLKSAFLANMNHEIRTPLNAIVGFSQVIVDEDNAENRKQYLSIIQHNNDLLQQLIADVLDLSKIESNTMAFNYKKTDLPALMEDIYSTVSLRATNDTRLELQPCSPCLFLTDRNRLTQIITNLLNNAIKHTSAGTIRFGYQEKESEIYFYVKDNGEGIPEDKLDSIFNRFVQLDEMSRGAGLGLAICKGLVKQMGGTIGVTSTLGKGSTFYFNLPIKI
jgi:signal transduction histidine kinase